MRSVTFKTSYEEIIFRLPGLFAYIEIDKNGNSSLHAATDSINGCYGRIIENLKIKFNLKVDGTVILKKDSTYSFKTILNLYYKYQDYKGTNIEGLDELKNFIERGIGRIEVDLKGFSDNSSKKYTAEEIKDIKGKYVPNFIYLINAQSLYNEMINLQKICELYTNHLAKKKKTNNTNNQLAGYIDNETEIDMCCKCAKFHEMGGVIMLDYLYKKIEECNEIAQEYYGYATYRDNDLCINYTINLYNRIRDLGIMDSSGEIAVKSDTLEKLTHKDSDGTPIDCFEQNYTTNSKLKSLRKYQDYYNEFSEREVPNKKNEDWLFYYREGQVRNISVLNDSLGNIARLKNVDDNSDVDNKPKGDEIKKGDKVRDLCAFGDVIEKIELLGNYIESKNGKYKLKENTNDTYELIPEKDLKNGFSGNRFKFKPNQIKFVYWTDVHLTSVCEDIKIDENKNKLYIFKEFKPDYDYKSTDENGIENYHGIRYEEIYNIGASSEINDFETLDEFKNYVNGLYDSDNKELDSSKLRVFEKYSFSIYNNISKRVKQINGQKYKYDDVIANATIRVTQYVERKKWKQFDIETDENTSDCDIIRNDFYEGVTYTPSESIDVKIDRGVTTVFDKHICFSEIKTFQDLEEFSNGSYFRLQE